MTKVLLLTRYESLAASSRVRFLQYVPGLGQRGFEVDVAPLLNNAYVSALYGGPPIGARDLLGSYARRLDVLLKRRRYDLLWVEKEVLPWFPAWVEAIASSSVPIVADYDDAWFLRYSANRHALVRLFLRNKIGAVMRRATLVVVGNNYLAEYAEKAGARRVYVVPSVIDLARYRTPTNLPSAPSGGPMTIGWIGSPLNVRYLEVLAPVLTQLSREGTGIRLVIVGGKVPSVFRGLPVESRPWQEKTEVSEIEKFDVGIMPLEDTLWERGKCAFKLLQVMAAGKPVVGSKVGANCDVIQHGVNGFLAATMDEWTKAIRTFRDDSLLRNQMGAEARRTVERSYSLVSCLPEIAAALLEAARAPSLD